MKQTEKTKEPMALTDNGRAASGQEMPQITSAFPKTKQRTASSKEFGEASKP